MPLVRAQQKSASSTQLVRVVAQLIADTTKPDSQLIIQFCDGPGSGSGPELDNGQWKVIIERVRFEVCLHFLSIFVSFSFMPVCALCVRVNTVNQVMPVQILEEAVPCLRFAADKSYQML